VTITRPPEAPRPSIVEEPPDVYAPDVDAQEALIEEARRRARRRRMCYAASALALGVIALAVFGFGHRGGGGAGAARQSGESAAPAPAPISRLPARANGVLTIEDRNTSDVINADTLSVVNPDGSGLRPLTRCQPRPGCLFRSYAWSPDGKRLAFLSGRIGGVITASNLFLSVVNADGTDQRRLARCGNCDPFQNLSWSPDSRRIVFATPNLHIVSVVTGAQRQLKVSGVNPVWSPAGTTIAFGFAGALFSIRPDGSGMAQIASVDGVAAHPAWSPDGTRIAFDTPDAIYVVDADGSHLRLLLAGSPASGPGYPSWSPRGNRILFMTTPVTAGGFAAEVWVVKPDGSGQRRLYRSQCCGLWSPPIWSPDGTAIAVGASVYDANGITNDGILIMDPQGKHRRRVFGNPEAIAWQPLPLAP